MKMVLLRWVVCELHACVSPYNQVDQPCASS
jgi:hypothetical protein